VGRGERRRLARDRRVGLAVSLLAVVVTASALTRAARHDAPQTQVGLATPERSPSHPPTTAVRAGPARVQGLPALALPEQNNGQQSAATTAPPTTIGPVRVQPAGATSGWPGLLHQVSAYDVGENDFARAAGLGVTLPLLNHDTLSTSYRDMIRRSGLHYIDMAVWRLIQKYIPASCQTTVRPCSLSEQQRAELLANVKAHVTAVAADATIAAFYILDDYPGNIRGLLASVHDVIAQSPAINGAIRPTVCALTAALDYRDATGTWHRSRTAFHTALLNYSPAGCDGVSIYSYAPQDAAPINVDWSMTQLLPDVQHALTGAGWKASAPFIGTPMAFSAPSHRTFGPNASQLREQIKAFCAAGASAIMPFAWDSSYKGPEPVLGNNAELQKGFTAGVSDCQSRWSQVSNP